MTLEEFKKAIDNNELLKRYNLTTADQSLDTQEIELIQLAIHDQSSNFGGEFEPGREIDKFTGDTLLVGGGKTPGPCGENDGKTILIDYSHEEAETRRLIQKLSSGEWTHDPYTGKRFATEAEKKSYVEELNKKVILYKEAFALRNRDILEKYYILNIERKIFPDIVASITSESDMQKIPDNKFMYVEFENVPCDVFLNPRLYRILARIVKPGGTISFSVAYVCRRLMIPIIEPTEFGEEFLKTLEKEMYQNLDNMDPTYGSCNITLKNMKM